MDDMTIPKNSILLLNDAHGQCIPRVFAVGMDRSHVQNVSEEDWNILEEGPDNQHYWETWDHVTGSAVIIDIHGQKFYLYQDGDLWAIPLDQSNEEPEPTPYEYACMSVIDETCGFFPLHLFDNDTEALRYYDDTILGALGV